MRIHCLKVFFSCACSLMTLSCGAVAFGAGTPSQIAISSGNRQAGTVGTTLASPVVVVVKDKNGNVVEGVRIDWKPNVGGDSLPAAYTTTNSAGLASSNFKLGTTPGYQTATATVHGTYITASFGATASSGVAETITLESGNQQSGTVGSPLPANLEVICKDQYGNGASHTEVDWTVGAGGGSVPYAYSLTQGGIATKALTLGKVPGANYAVATIHGTTKTYTFTAEGIAGPVSAIAIKSGNDQSGTAGKALSPFVVTAEDKYGNAKSGVQIDWTPLTSGDDFSASASSSSSAGLASSTLTLGTTSLLHSSTATIQGTNISQTFTATAGVNALVTIRGDSTPNAKAFEPYFLGLSYQKDWITEPLFNANNAPLVALFKKLGPGVLRIVSERPLTPIIWDPSGPGLQFGTVSQADLARMEAFLKATDWKILYGIALVGNQASCAAGSTNCAANEAAAASKAFGSNLLGFEIGNEPDSYYKAVYGDPPTAQIPGYTFADYISTTPVYSDGTLLPSWPAFASAIEAAVPGAPLTGPATGFNWDISFAESDQASRVSLLTRHMYHATYSSALPTMADLFTTDPRVAVQLPELEQAATAANIAGGYRVSECNTFATAVPGVTNSFGAALWTIDFLFANALYQSTGVNFHGGSDNPGSFSPILDDGKHVVGIGPDYYGLLAYSLLGQGGKLLTTEVSPSPSTFSAYAVQQTNGSTDVILNNKDPKNSITVGIARPGTTSSATSMLMTAPSLTATSGFQLGGSAIGVNGSWEATSSPELEIESDSAVVKVPPASAQIVHLK